MRLPRRAATGSASARLGGGGVACVLIFLALSVIAGCLVCPHETSAAESLTSPNTAWLIQQARDLLTGCQVRANDGTILYTPDGHGNYRALWTRDFAYMVENAGELLPPENIESCLDLLIKNIRADGATPDRVRPDNTPVYTAGSEDHPIGEPNIDNAQFLVIAVDSYLKMLPPKKARRLLSQWAESLDKAMNWIPRAPSGLVWNEPERPHSPYGFTDTVGKTGELLFESLLYWTACRRLCELHRWDQNLELRKEYRQRASDIENLLDVLWEQKTGAFLAATKDCRQLDIWGNAYILWLGFPLQGREEKIRRFLFDNYQLFTWHGQVRHLPANQHWERMLAPVQPDRYQNGAYWATASGWMLCALAQNDPKIARRFWDELIADFRKDGICECVNADYRQLPSYVVSAINPLAAAKRLNY